MFTVSYLTAPLGWSETNPQKEETLPWILCPDVISELCWHPCNLSWSLLCLVLLMGMYLGLVVFVSNFLLGEFLFRFFIFFNSEYRESSTSWLGKQHNWHIYFWSKLNPNHTKSYRISTNLAPGNCATALAYLYTSKSLLFETMTVVRSYLLLTLHKKSAGLSGKYVCSAWV